MAEGSTTSQSQALPADVSLSNQLSTSSGWPLLAAKTDLWKGQHATAETEQCLIRGEMVSLPN